MTQFRVPVLENFAWQQPVLSMSLATPPGSPTKGDRYIVAASPTGAWTSHSKSIAWYNGSAWMFDVPAEGWNVYNNADHKEYRFDGSAWINDDISTKADKVSGATNDHLATLDAAGNLKDSGIAKASVQTAITNSHVQNTDQYIDQGGANETTAAQIKNAATKAHTQGTDQYLDQGGANEVSATQAKKAYTSRAVYDTGLGVLVFNDPDTE